jgi:hypothetical protein
MRVEMIIPQSTEIVGGKWIGSCGNGGMGILARVSSVGVKINHCVHNPTTTNVTSEVNRNQRK